MKISRLHPSLRSAGCAFHLIRQQIQLWSFVCFWGGLGIVLCWFLFCFDKLSSFIGFCIHFCFVNCVQPVFLLGVQIPAFFPAFLLVSPDSHHSNHFSKYICLSVSLLLFTLLLPILFMHHWSCACFYLIFHLQLFLHFCPHTAIC